MSKRTTPIATGKIDALAKHLLTSRATEDDAANPCGNAIFWFGAGASVSAGIPSGRELSGRLAHRLAISLGLIEADSNDERKEVHETSFLALKANGEIADSFTLGQAYGELFGRLSAPQQRSFIRNVISKTNKRQINWTHIALGELVRRRYVHTVLTTNLDDLALDGLVRCDLLPAIIDGIESLNRLDPRPPVPQLVYLHGSQHTYSPRNSTEAVSETSGLTPAQGGLYSLLQNCSILIVVGYSGNPGEGVMELLVKASESLRDLRIYWISHGQHDQLSEMAAQLLSEGTNKWLIPGQDADLFFYDLLREMRIGVPDWFRAPIQHLIEQSRRICVRHGEDCANLFGEVNDFRVRLQGLLPCWEDTGKDLQQQLMLRQYAATNRNSEIWDILRSKDLNNVDLLRLRANAAYQLGVDGQKESLGQSVIDFQSLLRKLTPKSKDWAAVQNKLGNALAATIKHKSGAPPLSEEQPGGDRILEDAIRAYRSALEVFEKDTEKTEWAATMTNLGNAFALLGRWGNQQALDEAIVAYNAAMRVRTFEAMPQDWAGTLANLGNAYYSRGANGDVTSLHNAIDAYEKALHVITRETNPDHWARINANLAHTLLAVGKLGNKRLLEDAASKYRLAMTVLTEETHPSVYEHCVEGISAADDALNALQSEPGPSEGSGKAGDDC